MKTLKFVTIGSAMVVTVVCIKYKPAYKVTVSGQTIGYVENLELIENKVEKYMKIIDKKVIEGKPCDILHVVKLPNDRETVFLIQDMFPITKEYVERVSNCR